jgi:hydroxymethylbilane synthase
MTKPLIIGSRGSLLALWQANWVKARLEGLGFGCRIETIRTTGDKITDVPLAKVGTKGLFTKEIEEALLDGRIDLAVHSLKDLPTVVPEGLAVTAIPEREDPRDALIGFRMADLPPNARIGTSSLRRSAQLRALRPDLRIHDLRGNLDTRLRKLDEGQYDAIVLASAGLRRLGWAERISESIAVDVLCPAAGQGALAIETRKDASEAAQICAQLDDDATRAAVTAERETLESLGGGCQVPIGAHAEIDGSQIRMRGVVIAPDGSTVVKHSLEGHVQDAAGLGRRLGGMLIESGARGILETVYGKA